jgi:pimeloyl-ACP methyl ester carboxylesterase
MKRLAPLACCLAFPFVFTLTAQAQENDPPPSLKPPASMEEVSLTSHGSRINGIVYLAAGARPHPVVIFLHGYPGNEKNLDLAQAVRRAGYQAVYSDYRGMWGSGGTFSFANGLEDVQALLAWVRTPANALKYHFDTHRIALVGHSFGGWLALMTAAHEPRSVCVAALAAWNVGWAGQRFATHDGERAASLEDFRGSAGSERPVHAAALDLMNEMASHPDWDYLKQARGIGERATLLVAATRDSPDEDVAMHRAMARAIRDAGGKHVKVVTYDDDHPFSSHRLALADQLTRWLSNDCATSQRRR